MRAHYLTAKDTEKDTQRGKQSCFNYIWKWSPLSSGFPGKTEGLATEPRGAAQPKQVERKCSRGVISVRAPSHLGTARFTFRTIHSDPVELENQRVRSKLEPLGCKTKGNPSWNFKHLGVEARARNLSQREAHRIFRPRPSKTHSPGFSSNAPSVMAGGRMSTAKLSETSPRMATVEGYDKNIIQHRICGQKTRIHNWNNRISR